MLFQLTDFDGLPKGRLTTLVRDAIRFYVNYHLRADGIHGCYLHDPVTLIGSLLRPDLVTETVTERLACDTGSDSYLAGSLYRTSEAERAPVEIAMAIDAEPMKAELLSRLAQAVTR